MSKSLHTRRYTVMRDILRRSRVASGFTQREMADKLSKPQSYISKIESGERRIDLIELIDFAEAASIDLNDILKQIKSVPQ